MICLLVGFPALASTASRLPTITSFDVTVAGLAATIDPLEPTVPKNVESGVRIVVKAGDRTLTYDEVAGQVGGPFEVRAELSGPGLGRTVTLPDLGPSDPPLADPLLLPIPALPIAGDYSLSNIRLIRNGRPVLDVSPSNVTLKIIDQILVTSVTTRPLTLDEIREKGIVLDSDDYLGFEFTIGLAANSQSVSFSMPVVFDRQGVPVPQVLTPPPAPPRVGVSVGGDDRAQPLILPTLLELKPEELAAIPDLELRLPGGQPVQIPSVLVIPGNVGYLKQFFSAQLFVANGAPIGSGLTVKDVKGTLKLPPGVDLELGTADDPLALPETVRGPQPSTMPVLGIGLDGEPATSDDVSELRPAQQGQAEFLIRGEKEGFHSLDFDIDATLVGLAVGDVGIRGKARGGVLVRNPFFDMTFAIPSVVRKGETFSIFATVTNIGQGIANDVNVTLDSSRMAGATLVGEPTRRIDTLRGGDAKTLEFTFVSGRTGQVQATYLNFDTAGPGGGSLKFTLGVGERGVALSPDTLVLPASVEALPQSVVDAAMRVIGQAWSIANAPTGTLPAGVARVSRTVATEKALALAEAGLRVSFGQDVASAVRDLAMDFYGGETLDPGFDQLLRETRAGNEFAAAVGFELRAASDDAGGTFGYGAAIDAVAASGLDYMRFGIGTGTGAAPVRVSLTDAGGRKSEGPVAPGTLPASEIPGAVWVPLGPGQTEPLVGLVTAVASPIYTLDLTGTGSGSVDLSVTVPRGGGEHVRGVLPSLPVSAGSKARLVIDLRRPDTLLVELDQEADGTFETQLLMATTVVVPTGAQLISATVVGPETIDGASPFGFHVALLFDRIVDAASGGSPLSYSIPNNAVQSARSQLSGRFVFASLQQPEGPYVPTAFATSGVLDQRGARGPPKSVTLGSRLEDPGAVVSGRVIGPDGEPLTSGTVTYRNNSNWQCLASIFDADPSVARSGFAAVNLDANGRYEFRYVRQDACGFPWAMLTNDPRSGALRSVSGFVSAPGERIELDIALLGQGSVSGVVRDLASKPVPGAAVTVVSQTDPQVGGTAVTDGDGFYEVFGITVGGVSVSAAKGTGAGYASGSIARAGGSAVVNVTLDSGAASVGGLVVLEEGSSIRPAPGVTMVYLASGVPVAVAETDALGEYFFDSVPVGPFKVQAILNSRDRAEVSGIVAAGEELDSVDLVIRLPDPNGGGSGGGSGPGYGTVQGIVYFANGAPAPDAIVSIAGRGVLSGPDGSFSIPGVQVQIGQPQTVSARSRDGLRSGAATAFVNQAGQIVEGVTVVLSGLGSAEFTVLSATGAPLAGQVVGLLDRCIANCGCQPQTSDANGKVRFDNLPIGGLTVQAVRPGASFVDVARAGASITEDGEVAQGILRFAGSGIVSGTVKNGQGQPVFGAEVALQSFLYSADYCALVSGVSQRIRTDSLGRFRFQSVNVGPVSVTASQTFFPTPTTRGGTLTLNGQELALDLVLNEGVSTIAGELSGTVFLPDGVTPAGAGIEVTASGGIPDVVVTTGANGRYRFAKIFPEGGYTLTLRDPITGALAQTGVQLRAGEDMTRDVRLLGRGTVVVRVVDANDAPVARAFVRLRETSFPRREQEGAADATNQGVVTFDNVFEGPVAAEVTDPTGRGGRAAATLIGPGARLELKVTLSITGQIAGVFVGPDGTTPVPFGAITLTQNGRVLGQTTAQGSGPGVGTFSFDNVPAGSFRVDAQDPATARTGFANGTVTAQDQVVNVTVRAQGLGTVEGFVTSNGQPQGGAEVDLVAGSRRASTLSDATGRYVITGVPEGPVSVTASLGNGFLRGSAAGNLVGDGSTLMLDVPLADSGDVGGVVLRAGGVGPATQSVVSIQVPGGGSFSTLTDQNGRFFFDRLPAGSASLSVDVLGSIDQGSASVVIPAGGTADATVTLNGVGSLRGVARTSNGETTAGTVTISGTGAIPYSRTLAVGADGAFSLPEVLAGPFVVSLTVQTTTFTLYGTASGTVLPDAEAFVSVQVQPSAVVRGRALRADGVTAAFGTEVTLRLLPNRGTLTFNGGSDGRFETTGVPLGSLELRLFDRVTGGVGLVQGRSVGANGQILDVGDVVLDDTAVEAVAFQPADGSVNVPVNQPIVVDFSDRLASAAGLGVSNGTSSLPFSAALSADGYRVTLTGTWTDSADITVTATTEITDVFGRRPRLPRSARFRTVDLSAPKVVAVSPANQAIEVPAEAAVDVTFNEALAATTDLTTLVILSGPNGPVLGSTVNVSETSVRFTPNAPLVQNATFTVSVNGAVDVVNNRQTVAFTSSFKTHDTDPPLLALAQPPSGTWTANNRPLVVVSLSDGLSGVAPDSGSLALDGTVVNATKSATELRYTPVAALPDGVHALEASVGDRAANVGTLEADLRVDTVPPGPAEIAGIASGDTLIGAVTLSASATDALSGVKEIRVASDGVTVLTLTEPQLTGTLSSAALSDGPHVLTARAVDRAGNLGPPGTALSVNVNNTPVVVTITSPPVGTSVQQSVLATATASEPIQRMVFSTDETTTADDVTDDVAPYSVTLDLSGNPEGPVLITARAFGFSGDSGSASREVTIDRTSPPPPKVVAQNVKFIFAEPPDNGLSLVHGDPTAVENGARVIATNVRTGVSASILSAADGSFALQLAGMIGDTVSLVAQDAAGNTSQASTVDIQALTTLPPVAATLRFDGIPVDRIGAGSPALGPDGKRDAVFALEFALGANITRQLSFVDLEGPRNLSTRPEVGAALGVVKSELGAALLNRADGQVDATLTGNVSLLLFAPTAGLLQAGAAYRVTAAFTNGARFIGNLTLGALPTEEVLSPVFSVRNDVLPFDPVGQPGSLLPTEAVSATFSTFNRAMPYGSEGPPGTTVAHDASSLVFSVRNAALLYGPGGPTGTAVEAVGNTFSVSNTKLPFGPEGPAPPAGTVAQHEVAGGIFSVLNRYLRFDPVEAPEELLPTEAVGSVFSVENSPPLGCGDGIVSPGEACDDGNAVNGDGCDVNCTVSGCGNGLVAGTEACDDGNAVNGDGCDVNCTASACGNGVLASNEVCDDGNATSGDGCSEACIEEFCGDGVENDTLRVTKLELEWLAYGCASPNTVSFFVNETLVASDPASTGCVCDPGIQTLTVSDPNVLSAFVDGENSVRVAKQGYLSWAAATVTLSDGTNRELTLFDPAGLVPSRDPNACIYVTSYVDTTTTEGFSLDTEACDDGNAAEGDGCDTNCTVTACGNGIETAGEGCDDGNVESGDGCDSNCTPTGCGNGVATAGEVCDDGNASNQDACMTDCTLPTCGDAVVNDPSGAKSIVFEWLTSCSQGQQVRFFLNETLAHAQDLGGNGCICAESVQRFVVTDPAILALVRDGTNTFKVEADGYLNWAVATVEQYRAPTEEIVLFDASGGGDAERRNTNFCSSNYVYGVSAEPVSQYVASDPPEECDDGNDVSGDGCDVNCTATACGNGILTDDETCDDGNQTEGDGCSAVCQTERCGDGILNAFAEPVELRFEWLGRNCSETAVPVTFDLNGVTVASDGGDPSSCDCFPGIRELVVDDPAVLSGIRPGLNGFRVRREGELSWAVVTITLSDGESQELVLFDPTESSAAMRRDDACYDYGNGVDQSAFATLPIRREACDDGNVTEGDGCDSNCTLSSCGNGVTGGAEACDDGNALSGDGCTPACTAELCGDGVANNGVTATRVTYEWLAYGCDYSNDSRNTIELSINGELVVSDTRYTECTCEPGIVTMTLNDATTLGRIVAGENSFGVRNTDYLAWVVATVDTTDGQSTEIVLFDPGGTAPARDPYACNAEEWGVDTSVAVTVGRQPEPCDDMNGVNGDGCDDNCTLTGCNNGIVTGSEACDDGNLVSGDGCDTNCTATACGNGIVTALEECDDGNTNDTDNCRNSCKYAACGDGLVNTSFVADGVLFEWLTSCASGEPLRFFVNGVLVEERSSGGSCVCAEQVQSLLLTDAAVLSLFHAGTNELAVEAEGYLSWAVGTIQQSNGINHQLVLYDAYGGGDAEARNADFCSSSSEYRPVVPPVTAALDGVAEQCDDGNLEPADGCEPDCTGPGGPATGEGGATAATSAEMGTGGEGGGR